MTPKSLSLQHLIQPPKQYSAKPKALFMFHGYGSNEEDLFSFAPELPDDYLIISVRAPYNLEMFGHAWYAINFDAKALSYPDKINNVIALSGYINENILIEGFAENDFSKLNIYTSHGQVDQVIPLEWAQKTPAFLDALRIANTYEEFPVGHGVAPQNFYSFRNWLENR